MANAPTDSLFRYYEQAQFNPVPINLDGWDAWISHVAKRRNLYERHLGIPLELLRDRSVLEFGCNSGENALVLASFGSNLTLVEPNSMVAPRLREFFRHFDFEDRLSALVQEDIESFETEQLYDLVVAEGFLNTLSNRNMILKKICGLVALGGSAVISFDDRVGHFLELTRRVILIRACRLEGLDDLQDDGALELARTLYAEDFNRINVSRPFEAWWKDVLVSPFLATRFLWSYQEILPVIEEAECEFSSSSPSWVSTDWFSWYKDVSDRDNRHQGLLKEWAKTLPYFLSGVRPSGHEIEPAPDAVAESVVELISHISDYADDPACSAERLQYPGHLYDYLGRIHDPRIVLFNEDMKNLYDVIQGSKTADLISAYHDTKVVRDLWGTPCHYLRLTKTTDQRL